MIIGKYQILTERHTLGVHLSPCGRGRIASPDAIRVRGYGRSMDRPEAE
jgi:hypothetical protein